MAGGSQQREYPWGSIDPGTSDQYAIFNNGYHTASATGLAPIGTADLGAGLWGQLDMAGEIWEWNLHIVASAGLVDPCIDCSYLPVPSAYPVRWFQGDDQLRLNSDGTNSFITSYGFGSGETATTRAAIGFRCARTP